MFEAQAPQPGQKTVFGNKRVHFGTFSQASGDTGGDVVTGLSRDVECFLITGEMIDYTKSGGTVAVTMKDPGADQTGFWLAIGY